MKGICEDKYMECFTQDYNKYTGNKTGQMTEGEIYGYYINNYGSRNRIEIRCRNQTACEDGTEW